MKQIQAVGWALIILAAVGLCFPVITLASTQIKSGTKDVKLSKEGVLVGQVIDAQGKGVAGKPVAVHYQNSLVALPTTDKNGYFALKGVRPGVYQIASMKGISYYRVWAEGTAPPKVAAGALLVESDKVIRGQTNYPPVPVRYFTVNPYVVGLVATAIAVPVAIHNSNGHKAPVSP